MPDCVASIDAGTTSVRCIIFDQHAKILATDQVEFHQIYPFPGWQEQDPDELVDKSQKVVANAVAQLAIQNAKTGVQYTVRAVGITNQRETTLVWDRRTGRPLYNAIAWPDVRTAATVHELSKLDRSGVNVLKEATGLPLSTYFSAVKLRWMLDHLPEVRAVHDAGHLMFGTVDTWLVYNFTGGRSGPRGGVHVTDCSNASRTMLMDLRKQRWDADLCDFFGVDMKCLPQIRSSSEVYGYFKGGAFDGLPIAGILGDQQAALVGNKCLGAGEAKNTYGTGAFLLYHTGKRVVDSANGLLSTIAYQAGPKAPVYYCLEGSVAVAGSAINWVRDKLGIIRKTSEIGPLAAQVEDSGGVYFVTAFSGLFCPYWDDTAAGTIVGITQYTDRRHIARATIEATCYQTRAILEAMSLDSGIRLKSLVVDGGMTNSDEAMQIQADLLGIAIERPQMRESTALGSALMAGSALKLWGWDLSKPATLKGVNTTGRHTFEPVISNEVRAAGVLGWERAVERARGWKRDEIEQEEEIDQLMREGII